MEIPSIYKRLADYNSSEKILIKSQEKTIFINKSFTVAISPKIFEAFKENPTLKEISLPSKENIDEFLKGEKIDNELFLKMGLILDNDVFIEKWKKENDITKENAIERLMKIIELNGKIENMKEEIEMIGKNYEELKNKKEFEKIPIKYLSEIFKKVEGIKSEEEINKFVIKILKEEKDENIRKKLIESIEIRGLNNLNIKELLENIRSEEITEEIFLIIKNKFLTYEDEIEMINNQKNKMGKAIEMIKNEKNKMGKEIEEIKKREFQKESEEKLKKFQKEYEEDNDNYSYKNDKKFTQLHYAAKKNLKELGEILITNGADINSKDINYQNIIILFLINIT